MLPTVLLFLITILCALCNARYYYKHASLCILLYKNFGHIMFVSITVTNVSLSLRSVFLTFLDSKTNIHCYHDYLLL